MTERELSPLARMALEARSEQPTLFSAAPLTVAPTLGTPVFTDISVLRTYLDKTSTADDDLLTRILLSSEAFAELYTNHTWKTTGPFDVTKTYSTRGKTFLNIHDCRSVTSVTMGGLLLQPGHYDMNLEWGPATNIEVFYANTTAFASGFPGFQDLAITGLFGWDPPPDDVVDSCYVLASRMFMERDAAYSDAVQAVEGVAMTYFRQLPPRVQAVFDYWRIPNWAVV